MGIEPLPVVEHEDGVSFPIQVQPRSSRSAVVGISGGFLKVKVSAPPLEGVANEECIRVLAGWLHVPRSAIAIVAGRKSRRKRVRVMSLNRAQLKACLDRVSHD